MFKYFRFLLFFSALFILNSSNSQCLIGSQSNYAGSRSLYMNPAFMTTSHLYSDFSIFSFGLSAFNDYAYMKANDFNRMLFDREHPVPVYQLGDDVFNFLLYNDVNKRADIRNVYESLDLSLLSFMYNINEKQSVGFSLNGRIYTNGTDIPWELPEISTFGLYDNEQYYQRYTSSGSKVSTLEWMEVAFAYSAKIYDRYLNRVDAGVSLKYLMGYSAAVGNINNLDYEIFNDTAIHVNSFDADLAYALPIDYSEPFTSNSVFDKSLVRGGGLALDLGLVYSRKKDNGTANKRLMSACMQAKLDYYWKIGVSLMDIGFINFRNNAVDNSFDFYGDVAFKKEGYDNITSFDELMKIMSATYYSGDSLASVTEKSFKIGLPTTLRVQFDYNMYENLYLNATFVQPLRLFRYAVEASPQILLEPRYESDYVEFSVPLTLRNYKHFLVGASVRFGFFTVGTQNIASYLGLGKVNGIDLYVSLKFNLVKGSCTEDKFDACWSADFGNKKNRKR